MSEVKLLSAFFVLSRCAADVPVRSFARIVDGVVDEVVDEVIACNHVTSHTIWCAWTKPKAGVFI